MDKRRQMAVLLAVFFCMIMCSCEKSPQKFIRDKEQQKTAEVQNSIEVQKNLTEEKHSREQMNNLTDSMEQILDNAGQEFIGKYLVDEAFLMWLSRQYGDDCIYQLADAVMEDEQPAERWYEITGKSIHVLWIEYCKHTGFQDYMLEKVYQKECAQEDQVVLDFTGDINLSEGWSTTKYLDQQSGRMEDCISESLLLEMRNADILMINNEYTYSNRGNPIPEKDYTFRADPSRVSAIETLGTDVVSLANNHVYDYGEEALEDTLDTLNDAGIPYMGAGRNIQEAMKPVAFVANGRKITIVSATQIERSTNFTKEATDTSPGVLKTLNSDKFVSVIEKARQNSDYVIAFVHWGTEGNNNYGSDQVALRKKFIEAGADVIIGGHTHCLQGFEYYNGKPIIYSLGNFWFSDQKLDTGLSQVVIHTDTNEIDFRFIPCIQQGGVTSLVEEPSEKQRILDFMQQVSAPGVTVDSEGYVKETETQ